MIGVHGFALICTDTSLLSSSPLLSHNLFSIYALLPHIIISQSPLPNLLLLPLLIPQLILQHIVSGLARLAVPVGVCLPAGLSSLC